MSKKTKYQHLSKAELIRRLEALEEASKMDHELQTVLHDLHVHQEEVRAQNEQLLETKRSLEQSRDRYADLYDFAPIAYITLDAEGLVQEINLTGSTLLGNERSRILGSPFILYVQDQDRTLFLDHMRRCRNGEGSSNDGVRGEMRMISRKGRLFPAHLLSRASAPLGGGPTAYRTAVTDLTEFKITEEEKRQLIMREQSARAAAEAKDEFLAVVSHELRTPLTAILLWSKLLRAGHVAPDQQEVALGAIEHSAVAQQQLIEDLLDISRLVSGRLRLEIRETDIVPVIQGAIDTVRPAAELKRVHLEAQLNPQIGRVRVDPDRLRQVVWNLVHNAVKFTPAGGRVNVCLQRRQDMLSIEVKDTGQGISRHFLPHVFERFRQADVSPTRTSGGLGLGLAISRQLVELHGGRIHAESRGQGKGATFSVELPAAQWNHKQIEPSEGEARAAAEKFVATPVLQNVCVLLVEDDAQTRGVVQWLLERCSATVTAVDSAAAAIREFEQTLRPAGRNASPRFDLLISDIAMPEQDGYDLIRRVRELEKSHAARTPLPAMALTAYVREKHRAEALAAGYQEHVAKPIDPGTVISVALRLVGRSEGAGSPPAEVNAPASPLK
jgi:PAS domain S-box-containing protein